MPAAAGRKPKQRRKRWSPDEHKRFVDALLMFGRNWKKMEEHVGTKTMIQLRSHAQTYFAKAQKLGLADGLPPPRPRRKRKHAVPQQPQSSSSAGEPQCAPIAMAGQCNADVPQAIAISSETSASARVNHGGVESRDEPELETALATHLGDNSFMGTPSFFSEMSTDLDWAGTGSTSEAPLSSLPASKTMLAYYEAALEPWDLLMQQIKDIGLDVDLDMTIFPSIIHAGGSGPPPHHESLVSDDEAGGWLEHC